MSSHKKQKTLAKKRQLRRQRQKLRRASFPHGGDVVLIDPPGQLKMSKVLQEFVKPYMELATTIEEMRKVLSMGIVAWNAALLPLAERDEMLRKAQKSLPADLRQDLQSILEPLIERKQEYFAEIRLGIFDFDLTMEPSGPYPRVMSSVVA